MRKRLEDQPNADGMALISQAKAAEMCGMTRAAIHDLVRRRLGSLVTRHHPSEDILRA